MQNNYTFILGVFEDYTITGNYNVTNTFMMNVRYKTKFYYM